jgi:hypothetical protein
MSAINCSKKSDTPAVVPVPIPDPQYKTQKCGYSSGRRTKVYRNVG